MFIIEQFSSRGNVLNQFGPYESLLEAQIMASKMYNSPKNQQHLMNDFYARELKLKSAENFLSTFYTCRTDLDGAFLMFESSPYDDPKGDMDHVPMEKRRSKSEYPYTYDPFNVYFNPKVKRTEHLGSEYTDRLWEWDYKKYNACCREVWNNEGQYWNGRSVSSIERFLELYHGYSKVTLIKNREYCNRSNGYPVWRLDYVYVK